MATVTTPVRRRSVAESQERVHHPLQRVGGYIRQYVILEVIATLCLYLALWVWGCMAIDYGLFKAFGIDWADAGTPRWPRAMILGGLLAGVLLFVEFQVHRRVFKRMGDALAKHKSPLGIILEVLYSLVVIVAALVFGGEPIYLAPFLAVALIAGVGTYRLSRSYLWASLAGLGVGLAYFALTTGLIMVGLMAGQVDTQGNTTPALGWILLPAVAFQFLVMGYGVATRAMQFLICVLLVLNAAFAPPPVSTFVLWPLAALVISYYSLRLVGLSWLVSLALSPLMPLYLLFWAWFGYVLDTGVFGSAERWVVAGVGLTLLVGMFAAMVIRRMLYDFSAAQLALLLERRFPGVLGDRLITAVELADVKAASRLGYSPEMIEHTIVDAADRVDQVPVRDVFNWGRLTRLAVLVLVLSLGLYLVVGATSTAVATASAGRFNTAGVAEFHDVAGMWFDRNNLLQNVPWLRRAHLEVLGFENGEVRISVEKGEQDVHVRAIKWGWADDKAPGGYRSLTVADLKQRELLAADVPPLPESWLKQRPAWTVDQVDLKLASMNLPMLQQIQNVIKKQDAFTNLPNVTRIAADGKTRLVIQDQGRTRSPYWKELQAMASQLGEEDALEVPALPSDWLDKRVADLTLEQVEGRLAEFELDRVTAVQKGIFEPLDEMVAESRLKRKLRKFVVPNEVIAIARGRKSYNRIVLKPEGENTFGSKFTDIKETFEFRAYAEDFASQPYKVTLVPPPGLESLLRDEYHPAYLYYRSPPDGTLADVKGHKQFRGGLPMSLSGTVSRIDVPAGSDVDLIAKADKELQEATVRRSPGVTEGANLPLPAIVKIDETVDLATGGTKFRNFRMRFNAVRAQQDVTFEFLDTDNVQGKRRVVINPLPDKTPEVNVLVEIIRKTPQGYMVTPVARIPFSGKVTDDRGLDTVNYAYTLQKMTAPTETIDNIIGMFGLPLHMAGGADMNIAAAARMVEQLKRLAKPQDDGLAKGTQTVAMKAFTREREKALPKEQLAKEKMAEWLRNGPPKDRTLAQLLRDFTVDHRDPDVPFDLLTEQRGLKAEETETQPRYKMSLWIESTDTDLETGPNKGENKERFQFIIVSEYELLTEIAKEEEGLFVKLDDMTTKLSEAQIKLTQVRTDLAATNLKAEAFGPMSVRAEEIWQFLDKNTSTLAEVILDYERIIEEERMNRVQAGMISKLEKTIRDPLSDIKAQNLPAAMGALDALRKVLDDKEIQPSEKTEKARVGTLAAEEKIAELIQKLQGVLNSMESITRLNELIKKIRNIEEEQNKQLDEIAALHKKLKDELAGRLFDDEPKKDDKKPEEKKPDEK